MSFQKVALEREIPDGCGLKVTVDGVEVGLYRVEGRVYAMENQCPHAGFPLNGGALAGHVVRCPAHGFDYDVRTGFRPGEDDGFPIPCFAVRVEEGEVWVDLRETVNGRGSRRRSPGNDEGPA